MATIINGSQWQSEVVDAKVPVLVDFFATWCGPCKMMSPVLDEISADLGDSAKILKVDIDKDPDLASKFNVMSVPTILLFKDGKQINGWLGVQPKHVLETAIKDNSY